MGVWKKIFSRSEPKEVSSKKERHCGGCGMRIDEGDKYTKQMGAWFHRKCWNQNKNG